MTEKQFRNRTLIGLTIVFHLCGAVLVIGGVEMMPSNLPPDRLSSWLHPGSLTFIAGVVALAMGTMTLGMLGRE